MKKKIIVATVATVIFCSSLLPAVAMGRGQRVGGRYYSDANRDGVCDYFVDENNDGINDNCNVVVYGTGRGMGRMAFGRGRYYADKNAGGVCDNLNQARTNTETRCYRNRC